MPPTEDWLKKGWNCGFIEISHISLLNLFYMGYILRFEEMFFAPHSSLVISSEFD
jgi:hypothetical protein